MKRIYAVFLGAVGVIALLMAQSSVFPPSSGGGVWGSITGTLSAQADLASALAAKLDTSGTAAKATALASTPSKCGAGNYPLGVDTGGNAQNCTAAGPAPTSNTCATLTASTPASGTLGIPTDGPLWGLYTSSWAWFLPGFGPVTRPQAAANFTTVNFTGATLTDANCGLFFTAPANGASTNSIKFAYLTAGYPGTPWTKTVCFLPTFRGNDYTGMGFAVSDGTKYITWGVGIDSAGTNSFHSVIYTWTNTSSPTTSGTVEWTAWPGQLMCLTLNDDATNFNFYTSNNPNDLTRTRIDQRARTAFLTPTQMGIFMNVPQATTGASMLILHSTL
ncbi:MAG: hypothetical protein JWO19_2662 [Bryobacterales bacterium]|nr:hypothetical protein [Bryobacterales bacterium]